MFSNNNKNMYIEIIKAYAMGYFVKHFIHAPETAVRTPEDVCETHELEWMKMECLILLPVEML